MASLLDFPPMGPRPANLFAPPFVIFAIRDQNLAGELPKVSKKMVQFYAPIFKQWELPPPGSGRPHPSLNALPGDYVGINVTVPVTATWLRWVLYKLLEASGRPVPASA